MWIRTLILVPILVASAQMLTAQVIRGNLLDEQTGKPIESGTVALLTRDSALVTRISTDTAGAFLVAATSAGSYRLAAERIGFFSAVSPPLTLGAKDTLDVEFRLSTRATVLKPLVVTSRRRRSGRIADFYKRADERAWGRFLTREQIEKRHPNTTTDLLRTVPGVQLMPRALGGGHHITIRSCSPVIYIDGLRVPLYGSTVDDLVAWQDLEGIEIYRSPAEAPGEYTLHNPGCGVILFWTRID